MPVRSLSSSVFIWPARNEVERSLADWAVKTAAERPELVRAGFFGSYARNREGVGSDLDVLLVVTGAKLPPMRRPIEWDLTALPVPVDLVVLTLAEWEEAQGSERRFDRMLRSETVWVFGLQSALPGLSAAE